MQCQSYIPDSTWPQYQGAVSAAMDGEGTGGVQDKDLTLPAVLDVELTTTQLPRQPTNNHTHLARDDELASIGAFFIFPLIMVSKPRVAIQNIVGCTLFFGIIEPR